jgi:hypothetical protein
MKHILILSLFLCLNGRLFVTQKPIEYFPTDRKVNVEQAVDLQTDCPTTFIFDSGFEDSEEILQALIKERTCN